MLARLALVLALAACSRAETAKPPPPLPSNTAPVEAAIVTDPAHIVGTWNYRTTSNCGAEGVGWVRFEWDTAMNAYREEGQVSWTNEGNLIRWWGTTMLDRSRRRLDGKIENSLGDHVDGEWMLEGEGPDRLVVDWNQTNGCHGRGVATRRP